MLLITLCIFLFWRVIQIKTASLYCFHSSLCCSLKLECEKLATEKTEIQRHYVMVRHTHTHLSTFTHNKCSAKSPESLSSANSCQTTPSKNHTQDHTCTHKHILANYKINPNFNRFFFFDGKVLVRLCLEKNKNVVYFLQ